MMDVEFVDANGDGKYEMLMFKDDVAKTVHCIPLAAIASWGELLGIKDEQEVIEFILNYEEGRTDNEWAALYEALEENLDELAKAGVPAEYMADLVDPTVPSPVPGPKVQKRLRDRQTGARNRMKKKFRKDKKVVSEFRQLPKTLDGVKDRVHKHRVQFMDDHSPVYLLEKPQEQTPAPPPAAPVAELPQSVSDLQIHLTQIDLNAI
jgi:hypothetical protein